MAVNKVIYDGETLMDLTGDTVSEDTLLAGYTAHDASGRAITGSVVTVPVDALPTGGSSNAVSSGGVFAAIGASDHVVADKVTFNDGETFQQKLDDGELKGENGNSVTVENVNESSADGGANVVTFSDGKTLTVKNGSKGSAGADGNDGSPGADGFSPTVSVTSISGGKRISITDKNGTKNADIMNGSDGSPGANGSPGADGVSCTHSWNGTTLTITSASGTSSANLKGDKGDTGASTIATRHTATLTTGGWSAGSGYAYQQTVSVSGVTANTDFDVDVNLSGTDAEADALILEAFGLVTFADSVSGGIKFACPTDKPGVNIPIIIRIYA